MSVIVTCVENNSYGEKAGILKNDEIMKEYQGDVVLDYMGRNVPKGSHGSIRLESFTYSSKELKESISKLYDKIINPLLLVRRLNIGVNVVSEKILELENQVEQLSLFDSIENKKELEQKRKKELEKDYKLQKSLLEIKKKFGKNSVLKGMDYEEGATQKDRNEQIGGHKA